MLGAIMTVAWRGAAAAFCGGLLLLIAPGAGAQQPAIGTHLGVASCAGSNCHGASEPLENSSVMQNEYTIWSKQDRHRKAYAVLLEPRAIAMAKALGYPDAANQKICLDCHADNVPTSQRGREFQISDGVGCEACHGGASAWLGSHISGATHEQNIKAGLYPTDQPVSRAEKCLTCHLGDRTKFVDHRLIGAGHPRLPFELNTFTATEPSHYHVTEKYIERKGKITDMQVWAAGEAVTLAKRMDVVLDPKLSHEGLYPEFVMFDCQSCHHTYDSLHAPRPTATGLGPGLPKFNDANAVMLQIALSRVAPAEARALEQHVMNLHKATANDWAAVQREAAAIRAIANRVAPMLAKHNFTQADMRAFAAAVFAVGTGPDNWQVARGEQVAMSLEAIVAALKSNGYVGAAQADSLTNALNRLYRDFGYEATYRPEPFVQGLRGLQPQLGR
jgi:hypothetical protein